VKHFNDHKMHFVVGFVLWLSYGATLTFGATLTPKLSLKIGQCDLRVVRLLFTFLLMWCFYKEEPNF